MDWQNFGSKFGIVFTPDNHVTPIFRMGRLQRMVGPGYSRLLPGVERALPPVSTGLRVGHFDFKEVLSQDGIPFTVKMTVLFKFEPNGLDRALLSQLVQARAGLLVNIVQDYASQGVRRLMGQHAADAIAGGDIVRRVEQNLQAYVTGQLAALGLRPLPSGGVLMQEIIAPATYTRTRLNVDLHAATLRVLASFRDLRLIEKAVQAEFYSSLADKGGNLTIVPPGMMAGMPFVQPWTTSTNQGEGDNSRGSRFFGKGEFSDGEHHSGLVS